MGSYFNGMSDLRDYLGTSAKQGKKASPRPIFYHSSPNARLASVTSFRRCQDFQLLYSLPYCKWLIDLILYLNEFTIFSVLKKKMKVEWMILLVLGVHQEGRLAGPLICACCLSSWRVTTMLRPLKVKLSVSQILLHCLLVLGAHGKMWGPWVFGYWSAYLFCSDPYGLFN